MYARINILAMLEAWVLHIIMAIYATKFQDNKISFKVIF